MNNSYRKYQFKRENRTYLIEEDLLTVGWYLYEFDEAGSCIADQLQNSLKIIFEVAKEKYGIPNEGWVLIDDK